jgi:serine/threonine protein kinase
VFGECRAPEVSNGEPYSRKADVYSFGNLLFELLTNQKPFAEVEDNKVAELIAKGCTPRFPDSCAVPERLRRCVSDLLRNTHAPPHTTRHDTHSHLFACVAV